MRAVKHINNNAVVCEDGSGRQLVAFGRGIGFGDIPRTLDLADIQRTFYDVDNRYLAFMEEVEPDVLEFATQLADLVSTQVSYELASTLPITLADHLQFAIERARKHAVIPLALDVDVRQSHPVEYRVGELAVRGIEKTFGVRMPHAEAAGIALSIVNATVRPSARAERAARKEDRVLAKVVRVIERELEVTIDTDSFAYARFVTHLRYLFERVEQGAPLQTGNAGLHELLAEQSPQTTACGRKLAEIVGEAFGATLTEEELVYLVLHVNRVIAR